MIKKYLSLYIMLVFSQLAIGQNDSIHFDLRNFEAILAKAKAKEKPIFLDAYTTWCAPCRNMSKNVFTVDRVAQYFNETFINTKIDMEKGEGVALKERYKIIAFPTFLLLDSDGNEIHRIVGSYGPDDFILKVKEGLGKNSLMSMESKYKQNMGDSEFVIDYIKKLSQALKRKEASEVANQYFSSLSYQEKINPKNWFIFENKNLTTYGSDRYKFIIENREALQKSVGKENVEQLISKFMMSSISPYLQGSYAYNANKIKEIEQEIIEVEPLEKEDIMLLVKLAEARGKKDFSKFIELIELNAANVSDKTFKKIVRAITFIVLDGGTKEECVRASEVLSKFYYKSKSKGEKKNHNGMVYFLKRGPINIKQK